MAARLSAKAADVTVRILAENQCQQLALCRPADVQHPLSPLLPLRGQITQVAATTRAILVRHDWELKALQPKRPSSEQSRRLLGSPNCPAQRRS